MKVKLGDLDKGDSFINRGVWYKKLNEKMSGLQTCDGCWPERGICMALSQYNIYTCFGNDVLGEIENGTKRISNGKRTSR